MRYSKQVLPLAMGGVFFWILITAVVFPHESEAETVVEKNPSTAESTSRTGDEMLCLAEAIQRARSNSPDMKVADARIKQADAEVKRARAAFYPYVGMYTEYIRGDAPSAYLFKAIDQRELPPNTNFNDPGDFDNFEFGIKAGVNVFSGNRDVLRHRMAKTGLRSGEMEKAGMDNQLTAMVIHGFYNCLAAERYVEIARQSVITVEEQLRVMKVRFDAGGALKSDLLSLEVRLAGARETVVQSINAYEKAKAALTVMMGTDPGEAIYPVRERAYPLNIPLTYEEGLPLAIENRPDLKSIGLMKDKAGFALGMETSAFYPRVDLMGKYYVDDEDMDYESDRDNWTIGVMVNWDIFTGLSGMAGREKAKAAIEEAEAAMRKALLDAEFEVKSAYLDLKEANARLTVAETRVAMAEESLSLVKKQFEGGTATITRYLEAELAVNQSRINAVSAYYDREKAMAEIGRTLGMLTTDKIGLEESPDEN